MSYARTTWSNGDTITAAKLNNIETGILGNESDISDLNTTFSGNIEDLTYPKSDVDSTRYYYVYTKVAPDNLVDKTKITSGYYVNNGNIIAGSSWNITDKIPVTPETTIHISLMQITCFFDSSGTFLSQVVGVSSAVVPSNASYLISCVTDANLANCYITYRSGTSSDTEGDGVHLITKKDYESGFINFTVPVRQTKSDNSVASTDESEGTEDYVDVDCILSLPLNYTVTGVPVKLLMMCHGAGQGVSSWSSNSGYQAIVQKFVGRGYAVFDCNGFKNDALGWSFWGDSRGVECWYKAYQYVVDNYNVEHEFAIYGFSMGGLTAMNLAFQGFPNIKCIALGSPVLSLEACYYDSGASAVIKTLYGMGDVYDVTKTYGCDPYAHILTINNAKVIPCALPPIKIWFGSTETSDAETDTGTDLTVSGAVDKSIAIDFVEAINNAGGRAEYREVEGAGHEICYGMNSVCNTDYLLYIERFCKWHSNSLVYE